MKQKDLSETSMMMSHLDLSVSFEYLCYRSTAILFFYLFQRGDTIHFHLTSYVHWIDRRRYSIAPTYGKRLVLTVSFLLMGATIQSPERAGDWSFCRGQN